MVKLFAHFQCTLRKCVFKVEIMEILERFNEFGLWNMGYAFGLCKRQLNGMSEEDAANFVSKGILSREHVNLLKIMLDRIRIRLA